MPFGISRLRLQATKLALGILEKSSGRVYEGLGERQGETQNSGRPWQWDPVSPPKSVAVGKH